jgi:hypothetical protein
MRIPVALTTKADESTTGQASLTLSDPDGNPTGNITYTWQHWDDTNGNGIVD